MVNILSVDLEDYFMVSAFEKVSKRENWKYYPSRIEQNTYLILELLSQFKVKIKEIYAHGHEIACHRYNHRMITTMSPSDFREDIQKCKKLLEDLIGESIIGYRAPSYSITRETLWALEILAEEGFLYDSSIFPIHHDHYGIPNAPRFPFLILINENNKFISISFISFNPDLTKKITLLNNYILEFPISTIRIFNQNLPIAGGGYFRLFPYSLTKWLLRKLNTSERKPFIFYIHPWELDPDQPKVNNISLISCFRHYINLHTTKTNFKKLLSNFKFTSIEAKN